MWVGGGLCWLAFAGSTLEFESVVKVGSRWSGTDCHSGDCRYDPTWTIAFDPLHILVQANVSTFGSMDGGRSFPAPPSPPSFVCARARARQSSVSVSLSNPVPVSVSVQDLQSGRPTLAPWPRQPERAGAARR